LEIESAFVRDMDGIDLSAWFYNYRKGSDEPYDLGYWVGYRIVKAYYLQAKDRKAALKDIIELDDPKAFLAKSGWTPGMKLPASDDRVE
ncbi:MAG: lytic murein transglycosylase, partial [Lysobacter sp.]|nr:lytic murein transglycosylase [Lysobacter sp.]